VGPGPGAQCAITLNTALTPEEQRLYQDPGRIQRLLREARTIAIVGLSTDRQRASWFVANYLQIEGYRVVPIHPVDVFRPASEMPWWADEAIAVGAGAFWMQLKLANLDAAARAREAGLVVVADRCIKMEHARYCGRLHCAGMNTEIISARKARAI
jgi:predicted CoA-binding protein